MNKKIILTLLKKEILDIFRDTKTIFIMVIVPLILYPLIFLASMLLTTSIMRESTVKTYNVAIINESKGISDNINQMLTDALKAQIARDTAAVRAFMAENGQSRL